MQVKHARLVPQLRFEEFISSKEWKNTNLGEIANFLKGKFLPKRALSVDGSYPCIHYGELITIYSEVITSIISRTDQKENVLLSKENDILMPTSAETPNGLAKACCIKLDNVILGGDILVIRTDKQEICGEFLSRYIRHMEQKVLQYVTGTTVYHLYANSIKMLPLHLPYLEEQKKIANCLGSLDDFIATERLKLEILQKHKQGLIHQIFPQPGENFPRLRFPDFQGGVSWPSRNLGGICKIINGGTPKSSEPKYWGGNIKWLTPKDMGQLDVREVETTKRTISQQGLENTSTHLVPEKSIIISTRAPIGLLAINTVPMAFNQGCRGLIPDNEVSYLFLYYFLCNSRDRLKELGEGSTFKEISASTLHEFTILLPSLGEQQMIANCLGSVDDLIEFTNCKLEALKKHKHGLIQQLFPCSDD